MSKTAAQTERETKEYQRVSKKHKLKWGKNRNQMTHLKPKKKKRK